MYVSIIVYFIIIGISNIEKYSVENITCLIYET